MSCFLLLAFVFHCFCPSLSSCLPSLPPLSLSLSLSLCRALRTLIPITTTRAIRLSGQDPVHSAADGGQVECLKLLIQKGYNVNALLDTHISGMLSSLTHTLAQKNMAYKSSVADDCRVSLNAPQSYQLWPKNKEDNLFTVVVYQPHASLCKMTLLL